MRVVGRLGQAVVLGALGSLLGPWRLDPGRVGVGRGAETRSLTVQGALILLLGTWKASSRPGEGGEEEEFPN